LLVVIGELSFCMEYLFLVTFVKSDVWNFINFQYTLNLMPDS